MTTDEAWALVARMEILARDRRRQATVGHIDVPTALLDAFGAEDVYRHGGGSMFSVPIRQDPSLPDDALRLVEGRG